MIEFTTDSISWEMDSTGYKLTIATPSAKEISDSVENGKFYKVKLWQPAEKRSLSANAMYWLYLGKLAYVLKTSNNRLHNIMLRRYGKLERYGDQIVYVVLPDTPEAEQRTEEAETYHLKPTSQTNLGKDGQTYRTYMLLRGSSTYDKTEFARLLEGLLNECREAGIDVLTAQEARVMDV